MSSKKKSEYNGYNHFRMMTAGREDKPKWSELTKEQQQLYKEGAKIIRRERNKNS